MIQSTRHVAPFARRRPLVTALLAGLTVAIIGVLSGYQSSGTGYAEAKAIIDGSATADPLFALYKMGSTLASYLSGIPGGIFAPSLATGAGVGATLGHALPVASMEVMILLGMLAYFAAVVQAPLTAFIIILEMTADQEMMLALMATAFIGYGSSHLLCPQPLYRALAEAFLANTPKADY